MRCSVLICWIIASTLANVVSADQRPNVLFMISDDLNNMLGCYGAPLAKTPNLDRLARRGVLVERAYCSFPLCGPSRNSLLTGLYPNSTGIFANSQIFRQTIPSQLSLPHLFRNAGYFAGRIGKLYHYNVPNSIGTNGHDDPASWELELNPAGVDRLVELKDTFSLIPGQFGGTLSWYASPRSDQYHTDSLLADDAVWVLERCAKHPERPIFLAVGFYRPHTPYISPKIPYFDYYPEADMPVVQGVAEDQLDIPVAGLGSYKTDQDQLTDTLRRQCRQAYLASISFMDAQVGRVVQKLEELRLSDNTIIVFTSDHGYHMGEHGLWQKMSLFEESARVPLLIVAPGKCTAGSAVSAPVSHVDIFPTLAELCGVTPPENIQGQSLANMLQDSNQKGRGWALTQVTRRSDRPLKKSARSRSEENRQFFGYSLRSDRWRYTQWDSGAEGHALYDHSSDPKELTNLADQPQHAETVAVLSEQIAVAIRGTFPSSGKAPEIKPGLWAPNLTNP